MAASSMIQQGGPGAPPMQLQYMTPPGAMPYSNMSQQVY